MLREGLRSRVEAEGKKRAHAFFLPLSLFSSHHHVEPSLILSVWAFRPHSSPLTLLSGAFRSAVLPVAEGGYLPYWMLFVSGLAIFNSIQNFVTTSLTRRIYSRSPGSGEQRRREGIDARLGARADARTCLLVVNGLQARTFAIWTLASAAIRLYAAYNISNKSYAPLARPPCPPQLELEVALTLRIFCYNRSFYELALISYCLALTHFVSEAFVFRTAGFGAGLLSPLVVASASSFLDYWKTLQIIVD